jgi:AcrR family transcriptional regulator
MGKQTKQKVASYHHGDLRKALLDQAARILRERGEDALTMRTLGAEVGVSRTAPYHHFGDKFTLLCALAEEGFERFDDALRGNRLIEGEPLAKEHLAHFIRNYVLFAVGNAEYYDLMFGGRLWKCPEMNSGMTERAQASFRNYVNEIRSWQRQAHISKQMDPLRFAQISWSTLHGMSRLLIDGIYMDNSAMQGMCGSTADLFWTELTSPKTT